MTKADVCARIAEIGILPAARVSVAADALFCCGGDKRIGHLGH